MQWVCTTFSCCTLCKPRVLAKIIFLLDRKLLTSEVMKRIVNILLSIFVLLAPSLAQNHDGHKHVVVQAEVGLCSVDCDDASHHHNLLKCDSEFQLSRYLACINNTQVTNFEPNSLFSYLSLSSVRTTNWFRCPQGRAPPFSA